MLILPIINRNRILNVRISLKNAVRVREGVKLTDVLESEVVVNEQKFSKSLYNDTKSSTSIIDFIRNSSLLYKRNYIVTTKNAKDSSYYDVYEVSFPLDKINDSLDSLYNQAVLDMMKETPGVKKGKYVSLKDLHVDGALTEEKLSKFNSIVSRTRDSSKWPSLFEDYGVSDLVKVLEFVSLFDCTVISGSSIAEDSFKNIFSSFEKINSRDTKNLRRYYKMAKDNKEVYSKISYLYKTLYNKPCDFIRSEAQKSSLQFVKTNQLSGGDYNKAA